MAFVTYIYTIHLYFIKFCGCFTRVEASSKEHLAAANERMASITSKAASNIAGQVSVCLSTDKAMTADTESLSAKLVNNMDTWQVCDCLCTFCLENCLICNFKIYELLYVYISAKNCCG